MRACPSTSSALESCSSKNMEIASRSNSYELAFRMQAAAPDAVTFSDKPRLENDIMPRMEPHGARATGLWPRR
ncbi:hypothetical protein B4Q13_14970 [Lacticaseibacillus rhamnosus]